MADPVSLTASILAITQALSQIYTLGRAIKDAKADIKTLCEELLALKGVLEMIQMQITAARDEHASLGSDKKLSDNLPKAFRSQEFQHVHDTTKAFVDEILRGLSKTGRFKSAVQRLTWPFTKDEMIKHIARLERVKSWFMFAMLNDNLGYTTKSYEEVCRLTQKITLDQEQRRLEKQEKTVDKIARWIAPVDPGPTHRKACKAHQEGTGTWFLRGQFSLWKNGPPQTVLCLSGKSGAGKTVMTSSAVEDIKSRSARDETIGLAFFYCAFNDAASQEPASILGSLLADLSRRKPDLLLELEPEFRQSKQSKSGDGPKLEDIENQLRRSFQRFSKVYLLVDALNESKDYQAVINSLTRLFEKPTDNVFIMLTSIDDVIDEDLGRFPKVIRVHMAKRAIMRDIEAFVEASLQNITSLCRLKSSIKEEIRTTLIFGSQGMFRWVQCQVDWLSVQRTANDVRTALKKLPETIEGTYSAMLNRIPAIDRVIAREALLWLCYATMPLTLNELCEVVALRDGYDDLDEDDRLQDLFLLPDTCQGLITYNGSTQHVTLAHFSVKEYLTSPRRIDDYSFYHIERRSAHTRLASKCLTYLSFPAFRSGPCDSETLEERFEDWPLLGYATWSWGAHVNQLGENVDREVQRQIHAFFATSKLPNGGNYAAWIQARYPANAINLFQTEPFYYACALGLTPVVRAMLEVDPHLDINLRGGRAHAPIVQSAAYYGHYDTTELLLKAGADPNATNSLSQTALVWAKVRGHEEIAELLLRYQAVCKPELPTSGRGIRGAY